MHNAQPIDLWHSRRSVSGLALRAAILFLLGVGMALAAGSTTAGAAGIGGLVSTGVGTATEAGSTALSSSSPTAQAADRGVAPKTAGTAGQAVQQPAQTAAGVAPAAAAAAQPVKAAPPAPAIPVPRRASEASAPVAPARLPAAPHLPQAHPAIQAIQVHSATQVVQTATSTVSHTIHSATAGVQSAPIAAVATRSAERTLAHASTIGTVGTATMAAAGTTELLTRTARPLAAAARQVLDSVATDDAISQTTHHAQGSLAEVVDRSPVRLPDAGSRPVSGSSVLAGSTVQHTSRRLPPSATQAATSARATSPQTPLIATTSSSNPAATTIGTGIASWVTATMTHVGPAPVAAARIERPVAGSPAFGYSAPAALVASSGVAAPADRTVPRSPAGAPRQPDPLPGGSPAGTTSAPGGGASAFFLLGLLGLLILGLPGAARNLRLASESRPVAPFILIPDRPG